MAAIAVVGAGYVGLTTAACLAHLGHDVVCGDIDSDRVDSLQRSVVPIFEAGLPELVAAGVSAGRLRFVHGAAASATGREAVFLCVPTPQLADGSADLAYLKQAAAEIAPVLDPGSVVVNKSTVPVGSTRIVEDALARSDVSVVSNPEFLREGSAVSDFLQPDRIVIGSENPRAASFVASLYSGLSDRIFITDPASSETIKYAANAFLATKLSFANAVAALCEVVGANVDDVLRGIGLDHRIGPHFLRPGPGWGGSCFPKDTRALLHIARDNGFNFDLLEGVIDANEDQFDRVVNKVVRSCSGTLEGRTIGVWGLTYKAGTDDLRESPSLAVIERMRRLGARVRAYDPTIASLPEHLRDVTVAPSALDATTGVDALVVLTEWPEFSLVDPADVSALMAGLHVVDGRNILDPVRWRVAGFSYQGVGR